MLGNSSAIQQDEPVLTSRPGPRRGAYRKMLFIGKVVDDEDLSATNAFGLKILSHALIYGNDPINKRVTDLLLDSEHLYKHSARAAVVPTHIELGHWVMNV